jgi:hypothetical protein
VDIDGVGRLPPEVAVVIDVTVGSVPSGVAGVAAGKRRRTRGRTAAATTSAPRWKLRMLDSSAPRATVLKGQLRAGGSRQCDRPTAYSSVSSGSRALGRSSQRWRGSRGHAVNPPGAPLMLLTALSDSLLDRARAGGRVGVVSAVGSPLRSARPFVPS